MKLKFDFNKIIGYFNLNSERGLAVNSVRDWRVLFVSSVLILVLVFGVDIYTLLKVKKEMDMTMETTKGTVKELKVNETALNNVLQDMEKRAENFTNNSAAETFSPPVATTTPVVR